MLQSRYRGFYGTGVASHFLEDTRETRTHMHECLQYLCLRESKQINGSSFSLLTTKGTELLSMFCDSLVNQVFNSYIQQCLREGNATYTLAQRGCRESGKHTTLTLTRFLNVIRCSYLPSYNF